MIVYFCDRLKNISMKRVISTFICIVELFLSPLCLGAEPYGLVCSNQGKHKVSRSPQRPLVIDLVGHTLTVPSQVIGFTLALEDENGCIFTCKIESSQITVPDGLLGEYVISISKADVLYSGVINVD